MKAVTVTLNPAVDQRQWVGAPRLQAFNRAEQVAYEASGKGINVARALHGLGRPVVALAPLGGLFGQFIEAALSAEGLGLRAHPIAGETRLNVKVMDSAGRSTEFNTPGPALSAAEQGRLWGLLEAEIVPGAPAVLAGSLPPGVPTGLYADWTRRLQALGARVCVDASGEALRAALAAGPDLIKPNRQEAEALLGRAITGVLDALGAARQLQSLGASQVALSLGEAGAVFLNEPSLGEQAVLAVPPAVPVRSTVGCGDALLAGLVAAQMGGLPWPEAARQATALAAARAVNDGPAFVDAELARRLAADVRVERLDL